MLLKLLTLIERVGHMPTSLHGIVATLIPKVKGHGETSFRAIGMMPALYRLRARLRTGVARSWEREHRDAALGHQGVRSLLEVVYMQAMLAEAGMMSEPQEQPAAFLWDLSIFMSTSLDGNCGTSLSLRVTILGY